MPTMMAIVNTIIVSLGILSAMVVAMEKLAAVWPEGKE